MGCYYKVKSKGGALTKGLNRTMIDGFSEKRFVETADKMVNGQFKFGSTGRKLIP